MYTEDRNKNCSCLRDTIKIIIALQKEKINIFAFFGRVAGIPATFLFLRG